jgi:catechol 2,3-dioxygenase-like lactoylglutathione lyase family enzyme
VSTELTPLEAVLRRDRAIVRRLRKPRLFQRVTGGDMLEHNDVATRLPVQDLKRARSFYAEKLGLEPVEERPGGLLYRCGRGSFALFLSAGAAAGTHTQMGWEVADIETTVAALRSRGVVFEEYDLPGLKTVNGIAQIAGNYPSKGTGEKGAWFKDSEGNLVGIGQPVR